MIGFRLGAMTIAILMGYLVSTNTTNSPNTTNNANALTPGSIAPRVCGAAKVLAVLGTVAGFACYDARHG